MATNTTRKAKAPDSNKNLVIQQVIFSQPKRDNLDIAKWRSAIKNAESTSNPKRIDLYDIYNDVLLDAHLTAVIQKRKTAVLTRNIQFVRGGKVDEKIMEQIDSPWFRSFIADVIDTIMWGHSVFQFYRLDKWIAYDLIPRKHINPINGMLLRSQTDTTGLPYRDSAFPNLIEVGQPRDLGLLCKAAPHIIYKRNGMGDFAQFAELFGQPIREGTYDGYDEMARIKLREDLENMGSSGIFIHPENTQINLIDAPDKSGNSDLYIDLIALCNAEVSKLILGNTLTTDQGDKGTQALGTVHQDVEDKIAHSDRRFVLDTLNYDLTDVFASLGINTTNGEFVFEEKTHVDLSQRVIIDMQLASRVPIDDDYWYETYDIPKPENYVKLKKEQQEQKQMQQQSFQQSMYDKPTESRLKRIFNFFV
jgi:phage gp29-like protein